MKADIFEKLTRVSLIAYVTFSIIDLFIVMNLLVNYKPLDGKNLLLYSFYLCSTIDLLSFKMTIIRRQKTTKDLELD